MPLLLGLGRGVGTQAIRSGLGAATRSFGQRAAVGAGENAFSAAGQGLSRGLSGIWGSTKSLFRRKAPPVTTTGPLNSTVSYGTGPVAPLTAAAPLKSTVSFGTTGQAAPIQGGASSFSGGLRSAGAPTTGAAPPPLTAQKIRNARGNRPWYKPRIPFVGQYYANDQGALGRAGSYAKGGLMLMGAYAPVQTAQLPGQLRAAGEQGAGEALATYRSRPIWEQLATPFASDSYFASKLPPNVGQNYMAHRSGQPSNYDKLRAAYMGQTLS